MKTNTLKPKQVSIASILGLLSLFFPIQFTYAVSLGGNWNWERGGAIKSFLGLKGLNQQGIFERDRVYFNEERFRVQGALTHPNFRLEFADEAYVFIERDNPSPLILPDFKPTSAWKAQWTLLDRKDVSIVGRLDRFFAQFILGDVQIIVGKQVIATGVGQIFTAVSQVQRYLFDFIDPEFPKTEDAVSVIWAGPLQLEARFLPKASDQREQNFHLRAKGNKNNFDFALTTGKSDDKFYLGLETAGNIGDGLIRGELVGYDAKNKDYLQGLLGFDYVFSAKWSGKAELFYNGFGRAGDYVFEIFPHRTAPFRGQWYGALLLTWEIHPLLKGHWLSIVNLQDPSSLMHLYFNYSLGNSLDLLAGQFLNLGKMQSEFGGRLAVAPPNFELGMTNITYAALRWYY
ncbi:MAG: hypothetical protein HQ462_04725 [Deltaproteobacteria bacterium]|nr:hypothetical protein [Deltaproteobacteria bacterium]